MQKYYTNDTDWRYLISWMTFLNWEDDDQNVGLKSDMKRIMWKTNVYILANINDSAKMNLNEETIIERWKSDDWVMMEWMEWWNDEKWWLRQSQIDGEWEIMIMSVIFYSVLFRVCCC
jgi:hypothetical protein